MKIPIRPDDLSRMVAYVKMMSERNFNKDYVVCESPWKKPEPLPDCIENLRKGDYILYQDEVTGDEYEIRNDSSTIYMTKTDSEGK